MAALREKGYTGVQVQVKESQVERLVRRAHELATDPRVEGESQAHRKT